jgi:hypothetical protein
MVIVGSVPTADSALGDDEEFKRRRRRLGKTVASERQK